MKVIAKKNRALANANLGFIKPVFKFDDHAQRYIAASADMFPNEGEIFIYGGYGNIDNFYQEEELFEIDNVNQNQANYREDDPRSCYFSSNVSGNISNIKKISYIKILEVSFQYPSKSVKELGYNRIEFPFFIESNNYLTGPFQYDGAELQSVEISYFDDEEYDDDETIQDILLENRDCIYKFEKVKISESISNGYVIDLDELLRNSSKQILYFGSKESVIEWGKSILKLSLNDAESQALTKLKDLSIPNLTSVVDRQKLELLLSYIDATDLWLNSELPKYLSIFFKTDESSLYIEKFLEDNKVSFFAQYRKDELLEVDTVIKNKSDELNAIEQRFTEYSLKIDQHEDKIFDGIDDEEKETLKSIIKNTETRGKLLSYYKENKVLAEIMTDISQKEGARNYLEGLINELQSKQNVITDAIESVKNDFFKDSNFAKKIMEAQLYSDLLNNIDPRGAEQEINPNNKSDSVMIINDSSFESLKLFIQEIQARLQKLGRSTPYNDVANYVICIYQNFLTVFVGLPGVGKTSMVEKLAKCIGCVDNNRYLKIPVSRGWTSSKDILGYFNPLTKKYQKSKTGLLTTLEASSRDYKADNSFPSLILLDEANLSPIEHYWSDFLAISDDEYMKSINKTDNERIEFGDGIRFLATINYDHTTEFISSRLISRAPIIKLAGSNYSFDDVKKASPEMDIFSMKKLHVLFSQKTNKDYFKGDVKNKFDSIVKTLEDEESSLGTPIILGHRKFNSIERYCNVAGVVMDGENNFTALDYSINQFVLPMIAGRGESFGKRLNLLAEKLQGLTLSTNHIRKIIKVGDENFKNYNFFC